jgi:hypothetical protein
MLFGEIVSSVLELISGQAKAWEVGCMTITLVACILLNPLMDQRTERIFGPDLLCKRGYAGIVLLAFSLSVQLAH